MLKLLPHLIGVLASFLFNDANECFIHVDLVYGYCALNIKGISVQGVSCGMLEKVLDLTNLDEILQI